MEIVIVGGRRAAIAIRPSFHFVYSRNFYYFCKNKTIGENHASNFNHSDVDTHSRARRRSVAALGDSRHTRTHIHRATTTANRPRRLGCRHRRARQQHLCLRLAPSQRQSLHNPRSAHIASDTPRRNSPLAHQCQRYIYFEDRRHDEARNNLIFHLRKTK